MLFLVVEHFRNRDARPVYERFKERGRLAPAGLNYVNSWVTDDLARCYQVMECDDRALLDQWIAAWTDLVEFEVYPVITSAEASSRVFGTTPAAQAKQSITRVTLVVRDYDEAIDYFTKQLGFWLIEDEKLTAEKRWVVVAPASGSGVSLLLARAANAEQSAAVGEQAGGRVFLFMDTDDFDRDYAAFHARGVHFIEKPRQETYGTVAVFEDLYGNRWDLVQRR